jgi:hypothetical protein
MVRAQEFAYHANVDRFRRLLQGDLAEPQRKLIAGLLAEEHRKAAARGWSHPT